MLKLINVLKRVQTWCQDWLHVYVIFPELFSFLLFWHFLKDDVAGSSVEFWSLVLFPLLGCTFLGNWSQSTWSHRHRFRVVAWCFLSFGCLFLHITDSDVGLLSSFATNFLGKLWIGSSILVKLLLLLHGFLGKHLFKLLTAIMIFQQLLL